MTDIWTGTAEVENGSAVVTVVTGTGLSDFNCTSGSIVALDGTIYFVASRADTLSFALTRVYAGADGTVPLEIWPINENTAALVNLATVVERTRASIRVLDKNSQGLFFTLIGVTGNADPGPGNIALDNADPASATEAYIDYLDANDAHRDVSALLARFDVGTTIRLRSLASTAYYEYDIAGTIMDEGGHFRAALTYVGHAGIIGAGEAIALSWIRSGKGLDADAGGTFEDRGDFDLEDGGFIYLSSNGNGADLDGSVLFFKNTAADADWSDGFPLTGSRGYRGWSPVLGLVNDGVRRVIKLTAYVGGEGDAPTEGLNRYLSPGGLTANIAMATDTRGPVGLSAYEVAVIAGFVGDVAAWQASLVGKNAYQVAVANGFVGDQPAWLASLHGAAGTGPGVLLTWDDGLTIGDPGAGNIRATDDDLGAALHLVVSKVNAAGDNIEPFLLSLGESTNVRKGQITLTRAGGNAQGLFGLAGITNGAGYVVLDLVPDSQSGTSGFLDGNAVWFQFDRDGNQGSADLTSVVAATNAAPPKVAPVATDKLLIADSEDSDQGKSAVLGALRDAIGTLAHGELIKTDSYTIVAADVGTAMVANKATAMTFSFEAAATLGSDFAVLVKNIGAGLLTLDPNGSELIDASATRTMRQGESLLVVSNGAGLRTLFAGVAFGGDAGAGGATGLVPAPAAGDAAAAKFLRADGAWAAVPIADLELAFEQMALQMADSANVALFLGPTGNRVADSFDALTYVHVAGSTNLDTSTPGVLKPTVTAGVNISQALGANIGDLTASGGLAALWDGNIGTYGQKATNSAYAGKTYSPARTVGALVVSPAAGASFNSSTSSLGVSTLQLYGKTGSAPANGTDGTLLSTGTQASIGASVTLTDNSGATWDHVWLYITTTGAAFVRVAEMQFVAPATVDNLTVRSTTFTAATVPTKMKALLRVKEVDVAVAGTDYTLKCSRDGGTTWATMALTELFTSPSPTAGIRVVEAAETDVSGQPSGTAPRWQFETPTGKLVELHDTYFYWS